jgi:staphylococcal nuclease domain-containing protein 1
MRSSDHCLVKLKTHALGVFSQTRTMIFSLINFASFVKLAGPDSDYHTEAIARFCALCEGRKLVANIDHKEGSLLHLRLMDPSDPAVAEDPLTSINADLLREGVAVIDRKGCKYLSSYPAVVKKLQEAVAGAKKDRLGMFEFGDVEEDED